MHMYAHVHTCTHTWITCACTARTRARTSLILQLLGNADAAVHKGGDVPEVRLDKPT
jgi:hypothetical protein